MVRKSFDPVFLLNSSLPFGRFFLRASNLLDEPSGDTPASLQPPSELAADRYRRRCREQVQRNSASVPLLPSLLLVETAAYNVNVVIVGPPQTKAVSKRSVADIETGDRPRLARPLARAIGWLSVNA